MGTPRPLFLVTHDEPMQPRPRPHHYEIPPIEEFARAARKFDITEPELGYKIAMYPQTLLAIRRDYLPLLRRLTRQNLPEKIDSALRHVGHDAVEVQSAKPARGRHVFFASNSHASLGRMLEAASGGLPEGGKLGLVVLDTHVDLNKPFAQDEPWTDRSSAVYEGLPMVAHAVVAGEMDWQEANPSYHPALLDKRASALRLKPGFQAKKAAAAIVGRLARSGATHVVFSIDADVLDSRKFSGFLYHPIKALMELSNRNERFFWWGFGSFRNFPERVDEKGLSSVEVKRLVSEVSRQAKKKGLQIGVETKNGRVLGEITELQPTWDSGLRTTRAMASAASAIAKHAPTPKND